MENPLHLNVSDRELWQDFKRGNKFAFSKIYRKHARGLFNYGYKLTADASLIEDCIHDVFMELWRRRGFLSDISCIKLYLLRALDRKLKRSMIRQRSKSREVIMPGHACEMPLEFRWIDEQIAAENAEKLRQAMETLSCRQREVLTLHFYEGRNYTEIAKEINIKYQSVANLMCQTLQKLRKGMQFSSC